MRPHDNSPMWRKRHAYRLHQRAQSIRAVPRRGRGGAWSHFSWGPRVRNALDHVVAMLCRQSDPPRGPDLAGW